MIIVNGSNVNIAFNGSTISNQIPVTAGYEKLADSVGRALAIIEDTAGVDPEEVEAAREAATKVVVEAAKDRPDERAIKRLLPVIKGVLTSAANSGASAVASELVGQLFVGA